MRYLLLVAALCAPVSVQAATALTDVPYWRLMAGWWRADNTYMDGALNYNIRSYNSLIHVVIEGRTYTETEIKFYAPSKLAFSYGRGKTTMDEGIETVTVTKGELVDEAGTVKLTSVVPSGPSGDETIMQVLSTDTGVRVTPTPNSGVDTYRMFVFAPAPDKRYRSNFGLVSESAKGADPAASKLGDLRGFSLFREDRIGAGEVDKWRAEFRARNNVKAIVEAGPDGKPAVRRLD